MARPLSSWAARNYIPLVNLIGVFFQIRDDYMNLQSTEVPSFCSPYRTTLFRRDLSVLE